MKTFRFLLIAVICILAGGCGIALGQCVPPPTGMVAWWPLDETAGSFSNDIAGSVNNSGTWMSSPVPVTGKVAGALSFNGSNSVDVPDNFELNFGTGDFSIDLWIKTTASSGTHPILDKRTGSVPNLTGYALYVWNGHPGLHLADGAGYTNLSSTGFVADGNWHHVAVTVDRDNTSGLLFYVDGSLVSTLDPTGRQGNLTNTAPFVMARNLISPGETFAGTLDELELFNHALDSLEVRSIWAADSTGKCKTDTCHANGDANNDAVGLTSTDLAYLDMFINGPGPVPVPLYSCDLNGDGYVNPNDLQLYQDYFVYGISVFDPYSGYPVRCPCNPIASPVQDTVSIFGMEHRSLGMACLETVDDTLKVTRLGSSGQDGVTIDMQNTHHRWYCLAENFDADNSAPQGASLYIVTKGVIEEIPNQVIGEMLQTKVSDSTWQLAIGSEATSYTLEAFLDDSLVYSKTGFTGEACRLDKSPKWVWIVVAVAIYVVIKSDWHTAGSRDVKLPNGTIIHNEWEAGYTYNEPTLVNIPGGPSGTWVDEIRLTTENLPYSFSAFSNVSIQFQDIDSLTIISESSGLYYDGIPVSNLGNAILTPFDTTLVVRNIGSSGEDGFSFDLEEAQGFEAFWKNVDSTESLPVGAYMTGTTIGEVDGVSGQTVVLTKAEKVSDDRWELSADMSPIGATTQTITVYNGDSAVLTVPGHTGPAAVCYFPPTDEHDNLDRGTTTYSWDDYEVEIPIGIPILWKGSDTTWVNGTRVEITPEGATAIVGLISNYEMRAASIPQITITGINVDTSCCSGLRGNVNGDPNNLVTVSDVVYLINYLFRGGAVPPCMEEADANGDGKVTVSDVIYLINYLFKGGPPPVNCST